MNKKSTMLLILPALALTGCAKAITPEEAKTRAAEIKSHTVDTSEIHALTFNLSSKTELSGKVQGKSGFAKYESEIVFEISEEKDFYHTKSLSKTERKEGDADAVKTETTLEVWAYVKDGTFTTATYSKTGETESRYYVNVDGEAAAKLAFGAAIKLVINSAVSSASGAEYLGSIENMASETAVDGVKYDVKFSSSGEGSLIIKGNAEFSEIEMDGVKSSGKGTVKYVWDKYLLSEIATKSSLTAKEGEGETETDCTTNIEASGKLSYKAKVSYPDLSAFQKN